MAITVGIVGLGYFGPNLLRNFVAQDGCKVAMACDLSAHNVEKVQRTFPSVQTTQQYEDILKDPTIDLVVIATPTSTHFPLAVKALEAGKHVFIEKPFASNLKEADELITLAAQKGKKIFVDHTFVFAPAVEKVRELAMSGALGKLLYFDSVRINLGLIQKDTNVLYDLAIHDVSILSTIKDFSQIASVCAHGGKHFGSQEEEVHAHLRFNDGFTAHIHVSWLSPVKVRKTMLAGTTAMVVYDDIEPSEKIRIYDRGIDRDPTKDDPFFPMYRSGDVRIPALQQKETLAIEAQHVLECLSNNREPRVDGKAARDVLEVLALCDQSLKNGGEILRIK